ncbi:MAG TPA: sulfite exporter TauE/SafE family protein [Thiotrichales bacterium]|nr:sulfite exporter TauE/SafE family protein [Thiotrichales bacterium]
MPSGGGVDECNSALPAAKSGLDTPGKKFPQCAGLEYRRLSPRSVRRNGGASSRFTTRTNLFQVLETLSPLQLALSAAIVSVAYLVRGIAGFGSGLIAIPLLALMMPLQVVVPLVVVLDYMASASHGVSQRSRILWREVVVLLPFAALGVLGALWVFQQVDEALLRHALGLFILLFAIYSFLSIESQRVISRRWAAPAGGLGGFIGTLFGTGGPFYVLYLRFRGLDKSAFRATFATIFLLDGAGRLAGYVASGFFTLDQLTLVAVALPVMVISLVMGGHIHTRMGQQTFQRAISLILVGSGLTLLMR